MHRAPDPAAHLAWMTREIAPQAAALDQDPAALRGALDRAGAAGLLGAAAPGPSALDPTARFTVRAAAAQASGTFAFLLTQHWGAVGFAAHGDRADAVARLRDGRIRCGIAYAHLRRPGPPLIQATPTPAGVRLRGTAPWMTGWGIFDHCVTAARLPDGRVLAALHPLDHPGVQATPPLRLAAFESANTVRMDVDLEVPSHDLLFIEAPDWLDRRDTGGAARGAAFVIGTAQAALALVEDAIEHGRAEPTPAVSALRDALASTRAGLLSALDGDPRTGLRLRGEAIALAGRLAHAAVAAWAGQANLQGHAAQRIYREVLGFTVLAQTRAVQGATLAALARRGRGDPP